MMICLPEDPGVKTEPANAIAMLTALAAIAPKIDLNQLILVKKNYKSIIQTANNKIAKMKNILWATTKVTYRKLWPQPKYGWFMQKNDPCQIFFL